MEYKKHHINVCICTYKGKRFLARLLFALQNQRTEGLFDYSIVVVDNDHEMSARHVVDDFRDKSSITVGYHVEPRKNIPLARNRAIEKADGDFIAFIDDDEFPLTNWLLNLYKTCHKYRADGVLGPVKPHFEQDPPEWILKAKLFERPSYPTGTVLHWDQTRTGNVLLRKQIFLESGQMFNPEFRHGEDKDFFRRMTTRSYTFVWCDEAVVYETQPPERFRLGYLLRRSLVRGSVSLRHYSFEFFLILKSMIAVTLYTSALPLLFLIERHLFMKLLIKDFDHIGRLLTACKVDVEKLSGWFRT